MTQVLILEKKSKQISTYTWRESKEIDINLYSTTIVNNYSAKQAVGKKKTPIINKDKRHKDNSFKTHTCIKHKKKMLG